jgi:predicted Zn-dependent protease
MLAFVSLTPTYVELPCTGSARFRLKAEDAFKLSGYCEMIGGLMKRWNLLVKLIPLWLLLAACATAPVTGRHQLMLVSEDEAMQMGLQAYKQELSKVKLSHDPKYVDQVRRVGERIAKVSGHPEYQWEFNVIDDPKTINAWALPGGKVAVYTGLLNLGLSDDELAAVLAHEIGHAIAQHSRERMSEALGINLGLSVLGASGKMSDATLQAVNVALGIGVGLPFNRKQESEADYIGLDLMARAGYDPRAALSLWQKMSKAAGGSKTPEFLSTHPSTERRMRDIEAALPRVLPIYEANKRPS